MTEKQKKLLVEAHLCWVMDWYEVDKAGAEVIVRCDDGTATQYAFMAGARAAFEMGEAEVAELKARRCSHGDYRMIGTDDCKNWMKCSGRTEIYVIGDGLCLSCRNSSEKGGEE